MNKLLCKLFGHVWHKMLPTGRFRFYEKYNSLPGAVGGYRTRAAIKSKKKVWSITCYRCGKEMWW